MTRNEQYRYAKQYARQHRRWERRAYRITQSMLRTVLDQVQLSIERGVRDGLLQDSNSILAEKATYLCLYDIYELLGPECAKYQFDLINERVRIGLKRESPIFDIGFFSRKWREKLFSLLQDSETAKRITSITETTRKQVREVLASAAKLNLDIRATARLVQRELGGKALRQRALLIARTETTRVANIAAGMGAETTGLKLSKVWIATADGRTRPSHAAMLGKKPIPKEDKFLVGGVRMQYPGDPAGGVANVVNCRCGISYVPVFRNGMPERANPAQTGPYQAMVEQEWV